MLFSRGIHKGLVPSPVSWEGFQVFNVALGLHRPTPTRKDTSLGSYTPWCCFSPILSTSANASLSCQLREWLKLFSKCFLSYSAFKLFAFEESSKAQDLPPPGRWRLLQSVFLPFPHRKRGFLTLLAGPHHCGLPSNCSVRFAFHNVSL